MAASLLELTSKIVAAHASTSDMTTEELLQEIKKVHEGLKALEEGGITPATQEAKPSLSLKQAFKKHEVVCMICGKGEMKTLGRHLKTHGITPAEYRRQFDIPRTQPLTASAFSDARKKLAADLGMASNLEKARAVRAKNIAKNKKGMKAVAEKPVASSKVPRSKNRKK